MIRTLAIDGDFSELRDAIVRRSESTPSDAGNHRDGGWKSDRQFASWPLASALMARLWLKVSAELGAVVGFDAWAMVHREGSYHDWHTHGSGWAGVCYLTTGASTVFVVDGSELRITPELGSLVLFPGNVSHRTEPQPGAIPRVTVAFNVALARLSSR